MSTIKKILFFASSFLLTIGGFSQVNKFDGIYSFTNGKNKLIIAVLAPNSSRCYMWTILNSTFKWEAQPLHISNAGKFSYYSGASKDISTCSVEGFFDTNRMIVSFFDTICFQYKFNLDTIKLKRDISRIDNAVLIKEIYQNKNVYRILNKTSLYDVKDFSYIDTGIQIPPGTMVISHLRDNNGYRSILFVDTNGNLISGFVRMQDIAPLLE